MLKRFATYIVPFLLTRDNGGVSTRVQLLRTTCPLFMRLCIFQGAREPCLVYFDDRPPREVKFYSTEERSSSPFLRENQDI